MKHFVFNAQFKMREGYLHLNGSYPTAMIRRKFAGLA